MLTPFLFGLKPMPRHREVVLLKNNIFFKSFSVNCDGWVGRRDGVKVFRKKNMIIVKQQLGLV
jgi:hypothetical protein